MQNFLLSSLKDLPLSEEEHARVNSASTSMKFAKGETVFAQGEVCPKVYLIRSGVVKLSYLTLEGKELIKSFVAEGGTFGSLFSQLCQGPSTYSAIALEALTVETVDYSLLEQLATSNAQMQNLLVGFFQQLALKKEIREYELLCLSAGERYQNFCREFPNLVTRIKQADLALYLGITPIALSRIKNRGASEILS